MKPTLLSIATAGALALPAYAHDHPVPHSHDLPIWALVLMGVAGGALATWTTMKVVAHWKAKS